MSYTHDDVAHNWAHQTGRLKRGFNMYYEGPTIFSYGSHFPIAQIVTAPNGKEVVLFTMDRYGKSTSKHITIAWRALGYGQVREVIQVPTVPHSLATAHTVADMRDKLLAKLPDLALKWKRARTYKADHAATMRDYIRSANRLAELWQLDVPPVAMPEDIAAYVSDREARVKAEEEARRKKDHEAIRKWVNGEDVRPPHTKTPYVRVKDIGGDRPVVQTSWGISVPLRQALAIYRLANHCKKCGHKFTPRKRHEVGGWALDGIAPDGTVRAGCHVIPFKVQQEAAKLAGLARA